MKDSNGALRWLALMVGVVCSSELYHEGPCEEEAILNSDAETGPFCPLPVAIYVPVPSVLSDFQTTLMLPGLF